MLKTGFGSSFTLSRSHGYSFTISRLLTKHPDVAGGGKPPKVYALWGHPLNRQLALARLEKGMV